VFPPLQRRYLWHPPTLDRVAIAPVQPGNRALPSPVTAGLTAPQADAARRALGILTGRHTVVLTGAGVSTDSGIPDYRGPGAPSRRPMTIAEFRSGPASRQRYWARSHVGWARIRDAKPNGGHHALAALQAAGAVGTVITQNVDGLHRAAGSAPVIDLHGRLDTVVCLDCGRRTARSELQRRLAELNPGFGDEIAAALATDAPDGDADLPDTSSFVVAPCRSCGGVLKPDVVFFGENVPAERVRCSYRAVDAADAMLVAGSSLAVMSGLRFVKYAARQAIPVVIVNRGAARGDELAAVTIDAGCTPVLHELAHALG
jgi:NAD-dependent SIR2 family protein deacetylase